MTTIDWLVLIITLIATVTYGVYKGRGSNSLDAYFRGNRQMPWFLVLLGIMGTQASAITFLSGPGQAYTDGMRFVQYYFGLPLAMIVICVWFVPVFSRLNVYTAYEYLEKRFDTRVRRLTAVLFLVSRGLSTGVSIYAPSLILSSLFGWNIYLTNIVMGGVLIIYTVSGGAKAVAYTQKLQLFIIFSSLFLAGWILVEMLPSGIGFIDALHLSGRLGRLNIITTGFTEKGFDWSDKYNLVSGLIGGFFLALSYFGTDQSQVGRYLTAHSEHESRKGLLMNGFVKIPMQFFILLLGALVFAFYHFTQAPVFFNQIALNQAKTAQHADSVRLMERQYAQLNEQRMQQSLAFSNARHLGDDKKMELALDTLRHAEERAAQYRGTMKSLISRSGKGLDANDTNYIFLRFVVDFLPKGLVGLLIAIIFLAAWGSIAAALNALASSSLIDIHKPLLAYNTEVGPQKEAALARYYSLGWGIFCVAVACFAGEIGNSLIETVNILGSLFYGTLLGIFITAFAFKRVRSNAVLGGAMVSQIAVLAVYIFSDISFLWYNVLGCILVCGVALLLSIFESKKKLMLFVSFCLFTLLPLPTYYATFTAF
jgi:SSS family solute:Na+ symporter